MGWETKSLWITWLGRDRKQCQREWAGPGIAITIPNFIHKYTFYINKLSIHPSIHPSSSAYPEPGRGGSSLSRDAQTSLSLDTSSSSSGGDTEAFPGQPGDIVSPACPRSSPGPPPGGTRPKHLPEKASRRHPEQMPEPPQLTPLDVEEQRLYSELLPSEWAPHPISKGAPSHPTEKAHFGRLYPGSCPFGHDPKLMTIGESRNVDWPVNRELRLAAQLFLHHDRPVQSTALLQKLHRSVCQSPVPSFPHSWTRPPDTWNSSTWGSNTPPTCSGQATLFRLRTMASDLEALILIPTASHSAANRPSACWRSWSEVANTTTSSAKSRDEIAWSPNPTPSGPWLRLEILSIKIMNRTGDKGQPCRSTTCTGNKSDLLLAMRTKLLLLSYRDRTALSKGPRTPYSRSTLHRIPRGTQSNAFSKSTKHMWIGWANSHEPSST